MSELPNNLWPGWTAVQQIGQGGFGAVYEIQRDVLGNLEKAAMKVISIPQNVSEIEEMFRDGYDGESIGNILENRLKRIMEEYSLMRKMNGSVNVVNCDDVRCVQHVDGVGWDVYIRMELLTPLMSALPAEVPESTVIKLGKDICNALVLCKKHEIVHRDIKPQNILVSENGDFKLGDFGIAKTIEKTMGGTRIGTYKYMAPEVYNNRPYGSASDIYSLGLVLYWLLNERRMPFLPLPPAKLKVGMDEEARYRRLSGEPIPAPAHGSEALKRIVLKACAYDPHERYASAASMLAELNQLTEDEDYGLTVLIPGERNEEKPEEDKIEVRVFSDTKIEPSDGRSAIEKMSPEGAHENGTAKRGEKEHMIMLIALGVTAMIVLSSFLLFFRETGQVGNLLQWLTTQQIASPESTAPQDAVTQVTEGSTAAPEAAWSDWTDALPAGITADKYDIEEKTLYSSRKQETTSSTEKNTMDGWEMYEVVEANGAYGPWSEWSATKVDASETREVESQIRYRYRDKETTTGASSAKDGWTQYDITYSWGNYGSWSDWTTSAVSNSDSRKVELKTQYRYRDISYSTEYSGWSAWSSWQDSAVSETDLRDVETRKAYHYYYFICSNCGKQLPGQNLCYSWDGGCGRAYTGASYTTIRLETPYSSAKDFGGVGMRYITVNGEKVFAYTNSSSQYYRDPITQYRYRTRTSQQVASCGSWSAWADAAYSNSSNRMVQKRTVYRYCDRSRIATYHFYRWGSWSAWSTDQCSSTNNRQVEQTSYYRYRDQAQVVTYYFKRWTSWSAYSETAVSPTEMEEVRTKTQYRYKARGRS